MDGSLFCPTSPELATPWSLSLVEGEARGHDVTVLASCDEDYLHLTAVVHGAFDRDGQRSWRYGDGFQVTLAPAGEAPRAGVYHTFGFSLVQGEAETVLINRAGKWFLRRRPGLALEVARAPGETTYAMAIPWEEVAPLHGMIDGALALNITCVIQEDDGQAIYQLVADPDFDTEATPFRRVTPVRLSAGLPDHLVVRARLDRPLIVDDQPCRVPVVVWSPASTQVRLELEVRALDSSGGPDRVPLARVTALPNVFSGRTVVPLEWQPGSAQATQYKVSVRAEAGGSALYVRDFSVSTIHTGDYRQLADRLDRLLGATERWPDAVATARIRLTWAEAALAEADPFLDPAPLRDWRRQAEAMIGQLEQGGDPLAGVRGYQRRAFLSRDGTLQPYSLHIPASYQPERAHPLLVVLHGSGVTAESTAKDPTLVKLVEEEGWLLCAPCGRDLSGWYLGESGADVSEAIDAVLRNFNVDPRNIVLAGFSMGGYGVWRLGLANPRPYAGLVVLSGTPECPVSDRPEDDPRTYLGNAAGLPLLVVHGARDMACPVGPTRQLVSELRWRGAEVTYVELRDSAHGDYEAWPIVAAWLRGRRGS